MAETVLSGHGLVKSFGSTPALRGVDLSLDRGEIVAVMGRSGSGKSTLLQCLAGVLAPDDGQVSFDGTRVDGLSQGQRARLRREQFGFVFQFGQLIPELPGIDNVALPLLLGRTSRRDANSKAAAWLERLGVADVAARTPAEMSGGQAQRVALARALVIEPKVLFADEPTGSLDSLTAETVMDLIVDTARQEQVAVLLVTHDMRTAAYSDREVVLRDGRTVEPVAA